MFFQFSFACVCVAFLFLSLSLSQENFELNHETLYLAVKLTDHYLAAKPSVNRDLLQLVGSTAMLIAAKFEVSLAPPFPPLMGLFTNGELLSVLCFNQAGLEMLDVFFFFFLYELQWLYH